MTRTVQGPRESVNARIVDPETGKAASVLENGSLKVRSLSGEVLEPRCSYPPHVLSGLAEQDETLLWEPEEGKRIVLILLAAVTSGKRGMYVSFEVGGEPLTPPVPLKTDELVCIPFSVPQLLPTGGSLAYSTSAKGEHTVAAYGWEE